MKRWLPVGLSLASPMFLVVLTFFMTSRSGWGVGLGGIVMEPRFADLRQLTATADCIQQDPEWSYASETCDPFGRANNYPTGLPRLMAFFGLGEAHTIIIGLGLIIAFALGVMLMLGALKPHINSLYVPVIVSSAVFSPPVLLGLERGNSDVFVFLLLTLAALFLARKKNLLAGLFVLLATIIKLFPLGAAVALIRPRSPRSLTLSLAIVAMGVALVLSNWSEWAQVSARTPRPEGGTAFGAAVLGRTLAFPFPQEFSYQHIHLAGLALFFLVWATVVFWAILRPTSAPSLLVHESVKRLADYPIHAALLLVGTGPVVAAYVIGANFDYRLMHLIPAVIALATLPGPVRIEKGFLLPALVAAMYLTFFLPPLWQGLGEMVLGLALPALTALVSLFVLSVSQSWWEKRIRAL